MSFNIYSQEGDALTYTRENTNFRRMLSDGVYEGCQAYPDAATVDFKISILGGYVAKNGVLYYDDEDNQEILDLGSPSTNEHHLIWIDFSGNTPAYSVKSGTYSAPAVLTGLESADGVVIAHVFVPSGASSIADAFIYNVDRVLSNEELRVNFSRRSWFNPSKFKVVDDGGGDYTLHVLAPRLMVMRESDDLNDEVINLPFYEVNLDTATSSTEYVSAAGWELTESVSADEYIVFYVSDQWNDGTSDLRIQSITFARDVIYEGTDDDIATLMGGPSVDPVTETIRAALRNVKIIALVDLSLSVVHTDFGTLRIDDEYDSGIVSAYTSTISSTAYGTGPISPTSGDLDIDNVIDNAAKLAAGTLDTAYDGFANGAAAGSGKTITADAGPVTIVKEGISDASPTDGWFPSIRISLDDDGTGEAADQERGVDVLAKEAASDRLAVSFRNHAQLDGNSCVASAQTWTAGGGGIVTAPALGSISFADFETVYGERDASRAVKHFYITFSGHGTVADDKVYRLLWDDASSVFYIEDSSGSTNVSADFTGLPTSITTTVWEPGAEIGRSSSLQNVNILGDINGPDGELFSAGNFAMQTPFVNCGDACSKMQHGDVAFMMPSVLFNKHDEIEDSDYLTGIGSISQKFATVNVRTNMIHTDQRYMYVCVPPSVGGSPVQVVVYDMYDGSSVKSITSTGSIATPGKAKAVGWGGELLYISLGSTIEIWDVEAGTMIDSIAVGASINKIKAAGDYVFVAHDSTGLENFTIINASDSSTNRFYIRGSNLSGVYNGLFLDVSGNSLVLGAVRGSDFAIATYSIHSSGTTFREIFDQDLPAGMTADWLYGVAIDDGAIYLLGADTGGSGEDFYIAKYQISKQRGIAVGPLNAPVEETMLLNLADFSDAEIISIDGRLAVTIIDRNSGARDELMFLLNSDDLSIVSFHQYDNGKNIEVNSLTSDGFYLYTHDPGREFIAIHGADPRPGMFYYDTAAIEQHVLRKAGGWT